MNGVGCTTGRSGRREGGYVLVMALLILAIMFMLGSSFLGLMQGESTMSTSDRDLTIALNAADAGVQQALQTLKAATSITTVLQTPSLSAPPATALAGGSTHTFVIANDPADPGGATTDTNGMVLITSTGRIRNAARIIETLAYIPKLPGFPAAIWATGNQAQSNFAGNAMTVDGNDTDPVTEAPTGALTKLGVGAGSPAVRDSIYNALSAAERTRPVFDGTPGDYAGRPSLGVDASLSTAQVTTMASTYGSFATAQNTVSMSPGGSFGVSGTHTYSNGSGGGPNAGNSQGWGTPASPNVYRFSGITMAQYAADPNVAVPTLSISGNFQGAGILILDGVYLNLTGNFRWEGIIIVTGPKAGFSLRGGGNQTIYGAVVVNDTATNCFSCTDLDLRGHAKVSYSQTAINNASRALGTRFVYWNEHGA